MGNDLISRQAAIDAVYETFCYAYCDNCEKEMNEDLCGDCHRKYQNWSASKKTIEKVINNLPSAQQWIPVTERLPKPYEYCLWTTTDGRVIYHHCDGLFSNYIAWMPLPEPYAERRTDDLQ